MRSSLVGLSARLNPVELARLRACFATHLRMVRILRGWSHVSGARPDARVDASDAPCLLSHEAGRVHRDRKHVTIPVRLRIREESHAELVLDCGDEPVPLTEGRRLCLVGNQASRFRDVERLGLAVAPHVDLDAGSVEPPLHSGKPTKALHLNEWVGWSCRDGRVHPTTCDVGVCQSRPDHCLDVWERRPLTGHVKHPFRSA